ncbi:exo-alpha-sialidase [Cryobacterium algoritolerans]|uniref:Exo-alpha-sialidase n=1 Tax=Cryobacterium algoritolerans TaxID=1259184 RepID=A0A4R8WZ29_9MICO|nr:sialidase family protein [Cryobacterium algoritolerans]TFC18931.1 exo-alpha-sialidase [Cryobacterium algoritolerans]
MRVHRLLVAGAVALVASLPVSIAAAASPDMSTRVSVGSPPSPFSQNKQNEPGLALDASRPNVLVAGSNDEIDMEACNAGAPTSCPFTPGVGVSGVYFSFDSGHTWTQPTYQGWTARDCLGPASCAPHVGSIGTLPKYFENGLVSNGDAELAFGPKRGANGKFSWAAGSRLYYSNIATNFGSTRDDQAFKGTGAIAVSRTDNVTAAAAGDANAWMDPVIVSRQSSATFSDKEQLWADNAASSPFFGNAYVCNVSFRSNGGAPEPVMFHRSTDGGDSWTTTQLSSATNNVQTGGRQGCAIRTDSTGRISVVWSGFDQKSNSGVFFQVTSDNGGANFTRPQIIMATAGIGQLDPVTGRSTIDGVAGSRTDVFPSIDIANGAPSGIGAPNTIVLGWSDDRAGLNNEKAYVSYSANRGASYSPATAVSTAGDRANQPAVAIAPDGSKVYITYNAWHQPWQTTTASARPMEGVVLSGPAGGSLVEANRGASGDARGSSANSLTAEFLGDYNYAVASNTYGSTVWNDVRNATDCPAVDAFRQSLVSGSPTSKPSPCQTPPTAFGNTEIFGWTSAP